MRPFLVEDTGIIRLCVPHKLIIVNQPSDLEIFDGWCPILTSKLHFFTDSKKFCLKGQLMIMKSTNSFIQSEVKAVLFKEKVVKISIIT